MSDYDINDDLDQRFNAAARHAKSCSGVSESKMLELYGHYKQATIGPCSTKKPPFWDMIGRSKWCAWNDLKDLPEKNAKSKYIEIVKQIDPEFDELLMPDSPEMEKKHGLGVTVSTLYHGDIQTQSWSSSPVENCQHGNIDAVKLAIKDGFHIDSKDDMGLTLLHWACDRGHLNIVMWLVESGANINVQDNELQTPLHYASVCDFDTIVHFLLKSGANPKLKDDSGLLPKESTDDSQIKAIFDMY